MFKRFWWVFLVMLPVGLFVGFALAAVVTYVMPKKFESEAVIQVKPSDARITPEFFGAEFAKITSRDVLGKVVEELELTHRWDVDREAAIGILKGIVEVRNIRGTDLISIRVRHTNKVDASRIAGEVAETYKDYRNEIERRNAQATDQEAMPDDSVVIHDKPGVADAPASPNVTLNLVLGSALGLLISPVMAMALMWILNRAIPIKQA